MRTTRTLAAAATAVVALGVAAPAAVARDGMPGPRNIRALPSVIARGGQLTITVDGCHSGGTATSDAFRPTTLSPTGGGTARGTATVDHKARPGSHSITVNCGGRTLTNPAALSGLFHGGRNG